MIITIKNQPTFCPLDLSICLCKNSHKNAEIHLKNRAVEISEPARMVIEKMRKLIDDTQ